MADYVRSIHEAYATTARMQAPAIRGRMALLGAPFTVIAAGAGNLHVIATREQFAAPKGQEVELSDSAGDDLAWTLRFYDPVVLPALGTIDEHSQPRPDLVRRALGVTTHVYHLIVQPGASLTAHHAGHAGAGLANSHIAASRDYESIRAAARGREHLVDELEGADTAGLARAHALLATAIAPDDDEVASLTRTPAPDREAIRRAVLSAVRSDSA